MILGYETSHQTTSRLAEPKYTIIHQGAQNFLCSTAALPAHFLEGVHQYQTEKVQVPGFLCSLVASLGETTYSSPGPGILQRSHW